MTSVLEQLQLIIPLIFFLFVIILTSITTFLKIRRRFSIKVNCWFCNENTSVPYDNKNSWSCPSCEQYNGFTEDGDYNKEIPAQRITKLNTLKNRSFSDLTSEKFTAYNGLCEHCNRNQELKMQQLASFIANDEDNYNEEIEEFQSHLEQCYRLCPRCERVLKRTLTKVKNNILGSKLTELGVKGRSLLDEHMKNSSKNIISKKRILFTKFCYYGLLTLSIINFISITKNVEITKERIETVLSPRIAHVTLIVMFYIIAIKQTFLTIWNVLVNFSFLTNTMNYFTFGYNFVYTAATSNFTKLFNEKSNYDNIETDFLLQMIGIILSICLILPKNSSKSTMKILVLLLWNVGQYISVLRNQCTNINGVLMDFIMIIGSVLTIILIYLNRDLMKSTLPKTMTLTNNNSFHKIYSECSSNSDISDDSDIEIDYLSSSHNNKLNSSSSSSFNRSYKKSPINGSIISLNTTKSLSPSTFTNSFLDEHFKQSIQMNKMNLNNSMYRLNDENNVHNRSFHKLPQSSSSRYNSVNNLNSTFNGGSSRNLSQTPTNNNMNYSMFHQNNHPYQTSVVDSLDLNSIKLGPAQPIYPTSTQQQQQQMYLEVQQKNPFSPECYEERPASVCSLRQRNILTPSRLHNMNNYSSAAATQNSWVAGGYWNLSPQKKQQIQVPQSSSDDFCPIFSRTSSQSSGFESQASSVHCGGVDRNSRESSVCDDIDRASVFSEPAFNINKQKKTRLNSSFMEQSQWSKSHHHRPQPIYPKMSGTSEHMFVTPNQIGFSGSHRSASSLSNGGIHNGSGRSQYNNGSFNLSQKSLLNQSVGMKGRLLKNWVKNNTMTE